jgi:hypothetical protein
MRQRGRTRACCSRRRSTGTAPAPAKATICGDGYGKNERSQQQSASTPAMPVACLLDQRISMWPLPGRRDRDRLVHHGRFDAQANCDAHAIWA